MHQKLTFQTQNVISFRGFAQTPMGCAPTLAVHVYIFIFYRKASDSKCAI